MGRPVLKTLRSQAWLPLAALIGLTGTGLGLVIVEAVWLRGLLSLGVVVAGLVLWAALRRANAREQDAQHALRTEMHAHHNTRKDLSAATQAAQAANVAKTKYMLGLSHELRTPLNAILGYAQLLERQQADARLTENAARTIKRSGEHLAGMIEGLLDISKIEAGRLDLYRHKIAFPAFVDELVNVFALQARSKGIGFEFKANSVLPDQVYTDEKRLRQILTNLLSNAVKFTHDGNVTLSVSYRGQVASFEIADTGIGIKPDDLERIFLPFERAEGPPGSPIVPGTGLGLTISQLLADIMGGDLSVESVPGEGTVFTVRMMLASASHTKDSEHSNRTLTGYDGKRLSILVAEDNQAHRALISDLLRPLGFTIIEAEGGHACLSELALHRPDLVFLDLTMPDLSGWDVARRIRARIGTRLPIVIISADAGAERNQPDFRALYDGYIIKPFTLDALLDQISSLLSIRWVYASDPADPAPVASFAPAELPNPRQLGQLRSLAHAGLLRSLDPVLADIERTKPGAARFCQSVKTLVQSNQLDDLLALIDQAQALLTPSDAP